MPSMAQVDAELCRRSLLHFIKRAWKIVEPATPFVGGWHIEAICAHLEAITRGEIKNLIINMPPRHMKTLIVSIFWPCWEWLSNPSRTWLFASHSMKLSLKDSQNCRLLVESDWYKSLVDWELADDQNLKEYFKNTKQGARICVSVGGKVTGQGGTRLVVDDPIDGKDALSATKRETVIDWYKSAFSSRASDPQNTARVIVMQRVHEQDLTGWLVENQAGMWEVLKLPAVYEPENASPPTSIGWVDPRTRAGELLWESRMGPKQIEEQQRSMGAIMFAGQYQQRPVPSDGAIFRKNHFRFYDESALPRAKLHIIHSWDMAFKGGDNNDNVVGQVWARVGASFYLIDQVCDKLDFAATVRAVVQLVKKYPPAAIYIEDKANGPAVMSALKKHIAGIVAVNPEGGKEARAHSVTPLFEAGDVFFPNPERATWVHGLIDELLRFPRGKHDDQVDALTQALERMHNAGPRSVTFGSVLQQSHSPITPASQQGDKWGKTTWAFSQADKTAWSQNDDDE